VAILARFFRPVTEFGGPSHIPARRGVELVEAYIDPGSGSLLLQAIAGGLAAVGVVTKLYWRRLRGLFSRGRPEE
jgi:hypothetical protein